MGRQEVVGMVELVVQYPGDVDWWPLLSVAPQATGPLVATAKAVEREGAQTAVRLSGQVVMTVDEYLEAQAR